MYPYINVFGRMIGTYGLFTAAGMLAMGFLAYRLAKRRGLCADDTVIIMLVSFIGAFIGAHILFGITNAEKIAVLFANMEKITAKDFFVSLISYIGGMVFYGGLIGALVADWIWMKTRKMDVANVTDSFAPAIPLFHAFARVGCFFGGCCYGVESKFGFVYTHALTPEANNVMRFPVQLLESAVNLTIFALLYLMFRKNKMHGRLIFLYLMIYPVCRFLLEFLRGDEIRGFALGLSTSQLVSILLFAFAASSLAVKHFRRNGGRA